MTFRIQHSWQSVGLERRWVHNKTRGSNGGNKQSCTHTSNFRYLMFRIFPTRCIVAPILFLVTWANFVTNQSTDLVRRSLTSASSSTCICISNFCVYWWNQISSSHSLTLASYIIHAEWDLHCKRECYSESILTYIFIARTEYRERDIIDKDCELSLNGCLFITLVIPPSLIFLYYKYKL